MPVAAPQVLFCDIVNKLALGTAKQVSMDELLQKSHFVSLHVPRLKTTENLMGTKNIAKMRKGGYLINLSRGKVVDVNAAAAALKQLRALLPRLPLPPGGARI